MRAVFVVPKGYRDIAGLRVIIENFLLAIGEEMEVDVREIGYRITDDDIRELETSISVAPQVFIVYGLNQCYSSYLFLKKKKRVGMFRMIALLVDSESFYATSVLRQIKWYRFWKRAEYVARSALYGIKENTCLESYDDIMYVSQEDASYAIRRFKPSHSVIHVIENGVSLPGDDKLQGTQTEGGAFRIGFISHLSETIIDENILPIIGELLPLLVKLDDGIRLCIAGKGMKLKMEKIAQIDSHIEYWGYVEKLEDFYNKMDIIISYTKKRNGILNKILEAWAYKKCVVGLDYNFYAFTKAVDGRDYLSGRNADEIAAIIERLLSTKETIERIAKNARTLVETHYRWEDCKKKYYEMVKQNA